MKRKQVRRKKAKTPSQSKHRDHKRGQFSVRKRNKSTMETVIGSLLIIAAIAGLLITPLLYYHRQTPACWLTFTAIVLFALAACLQWQKRIWEKPIQNERPLVGIEG